MTSWDDAIARLRARTGVAPALAVAGVLSALRGRWEDRVVVATAGNDLLFSRPGDSYPFPVDVRVSLVGRSYDVRLVTPAGTADRTEVGPADVDAEVEAYLTRLVTGG